MNLDITVKYFFKEISKIVALENICAVFKKITLNEVKITQIRVLIGQFAKK
jgi:hypothetical protein